MPSRQRLTRGIAAPIAVVAVVVLAILAVGCGSDGGDPATGDSTPTGATVPAIGGITPTTMVAPEGIPGVVAWTGLTRGHSTANLVYPMSPPVGGDHAPIWQTCGFYDEPIASPNAVHSMEHGAVWIAYRPDLTPDEIATVRSATTTFVLASPYPGLRSKVVVSAWERQLVLDSVTDPRLAKFISTYVQGPQTPELGARCDAGKGTPLT